MPANHIDMFNQSGWWIDGCGKEFFFSDNAVFNN
jgi:hypothetical protein